MAHDFFVETWTATGSKAEASAEFETFANAMSWLRQRRQADFTLILRLFTGATITPDQREQLYALDVTLGSP